MKDLIKDLAKLYEAILTKEKIEVHLKNIDRFILQQEAMLKENVAQMEKEERDIEQLEKKNMQSIFRSILGNKVEQMEKERQEYLQCYLKVESLKSSIASLENEKELLLKSYSSKFNVENKFDEWIKKKKEAIKAEQPELADHIINYEEKIAGHKTKFKELTEAIKEGRKVVRILQRTLLNLEKIEKWGHIPSKASQTNQIRGKSKIQNNINLANNHLHKFEEELYDISDQYNLGYHHQVNEIKYFIDQFYDSLITDWVIKERIEHSASILKNLSDKVERIIYMLNNDKHKTRIFIKTEKKDQRKLIMKVLNQS